MKNYSLVFLCLILFIIACGKDTNKNSAVLSIEDLMVKNNEITGWAYFGQRWLASNISELTTHIDGEAEIYQRHGFTEAIQQGFRGKVNNGDRDLKISIYDQGNETNAQAVYEEPDLGMTGAILWSGGAGKSARFVRYGLSQRLSFYRDSYYIHLEINYDTDESLSILQQFALNIDAKIK